MVENHETGIEHSYVFAVRNFNRIGMPANVATGFEHSDIVPGMEPVGGNIPRDARADDGNPESLAFAPRRYHCCGTLRILLTS
jgi:hypothetical protein